MRLLGIHTRVPSQPELQRLFHDAAESALTYDHVGSTLSVGTPRPSERSRSLVVGDTDHCFDQAVEGLRLWLPQRHLGGFVYPEDAPLAFGTNLLVVLRIGRLAVVVPDRVVAVVDEPGRRFGFAYGTLEGHAERGEESFLLERDASGSIRLTIRVDARPATLPARLAGPAVTGIQRWALGRYLDAIRQHVAA
jgi:uncharacterized protein (UPF0548 family)